MEGKCKSLEKIIEEHGRKHKIEAKCLKKKQIETL